MLRLCCVWVCVRIAMAGWLHGVFVGDWLFVFPLCGFSLSLFCNYLWALAGKKGMVEY